MKKQLLAAAVAAAIVAPMTAAADVTVYGKLHYSVANIDFDSLVGSGGISGTKVDKIEDGFDGTVISSHASRFGIKGSEDLGNGLSAVFQMEFAVDADDNSLNEDCESEDCAVIGDRNTYVALAGSWGVAGVGRVDTPYKSSTGSLELFGDTFGDYNQLGFEDKRAPDALFYMSPNWNGFSFVAAAVAPSYNNATDGVEATSVAAKYENGPFFVSLAVENFDSAVAAVHGNKVSEDKWRLGLGYTANGFHVGYVYEDRSDMAGVSGRDEDSWQLSASYKFGNNTLKAAYGEGDDYTNTSPDEQFTIGLDHKLSSRTNLYIVHSSFDDADVEQDWDATAVGIIHKF
jgi:predicted porin